MSFHSQAAEAKERMEMDDEERRGMLHILRKETSYSVCQVKCLCFLVYLIMFPTNHVLFKILCCKTQTLKQFGFVW